ncbi:MAG: NADH-quinone oxidoreductase subunit C [Thermoplasmata archaeon]|nr:NADH-quinone oxidoreductase subunit C [Thermoplasmata archaeon]
MQTNELAASLTSRFDSRILGVDGFPGLLGRVRFEPAIALDLFRTFRDDLGFSHLTMVGGIDWVDHREVFYALWSDADRVYVMLSANLPAEAPSIASAVPIWPSANAHERETWDLVGIRFEGHPDLRRIFMPEGYAYHPLLRSFKIFEPEDLEVKVRSE